MFSAKLSRHALRSSRTTCGGGNSLTLTPSQVDPNNTGNVMPFTFNGSANADQNLSIYMIDGASAARTPALIGVFDPDN